MNKESADNECVGIRIAGVVYILRLVPVYTSVDVPFRLQFTDALAVRSFHPPHCLLATNLFAGVFGYAVAFQKTDCRETT